MKVNKIQLDRLKQKCECVFEQTMYGKKYLVRMCKICKIYEIGVSYDTKDYLDITEEHKIYKQKQYLNSIDVYIKYSKIFLISLMISLIFIFLYSIIL